MSEQFPGDSLPNQEKKPSAADLRAAVEELFVQDTEAAENGDINAFSVQGGIARQIVVNCPAGAVLKMTKFVEVAPHTVSDGLKSNGAYYTLESLCSGGVTRDMYAKEVFSISPDDNASEEVDVMRLKPSYGLEPEIFSVASLMNEISGAALVPTKEASAILRRDVRKMKQYNTEDPYMLYPGGRPLAIK